MPDESPVLSDRLYCPHCEEPLQAPPEERTKLYELFNLLTAPAGSGGAEGQVEDALLYLREPVAETDALVAEVEALRNAVRKALANLSPGTTAYEVLSAASDGTGGTR
jgi:hypothetical protein